MDKTKFINELYQDIVPNSTGNTLYKLDLVAYNPNKPGYQVKLLLSPEEFTLIKTQQELRHVNQLSRDTLKGTNKRTYARVTPRKDFEPLGRTQNPNFQRWTSLVVV